MSTMIPFEGLVVSIWDPIDDKVTKLLENVEYLHGSKPSDLKMTPVFFVCFLR